MSSPHPPAQRLAHNAALNAAALGLQSVAAVLIVPFLVRGLGSESFGAFQLVWVVLSYLALIDIGLGRATTRFVADALGRQAPLEIPDIVWSAATLQIVLGSVGAVLLALLSGPVTRHLLTVPAVLQPAVVASLRWMGLALPAILLSASFSGALEAHQRFDLVNAVRIPSGWATLLAPLLALAAGFKLVGVVVAVVVVRYLTMISFFLVCRGAVRNLGGWPRMGTRRLGGLLRFGGWVTVSSVISPLMVYLDRFMIGARLGLQAVAHYTAPFDAITRAAIVPSSLAQALFPAFSALHAADDSSRTARIAGGAVRILAVAIGALAAVVIVAAHTGLRLWLGTTFADAGALPLRILAVGVLANALAQVPFALLQGAGRADLTATLHLIELPAYAGILWALTARYGIDGAAVAWTLRCAVDAALLFITVRRSRGISLPLWRPLLLSGAVPVAAAALLASRLHGPAALAAAAGLGLLAVTAGWRLVLQDGERNAALRLAFARTKFLRS